MDLSKHNKNFVLFACYCDFDEVAEAINDAKKYCKDNNLTSKQVKILKGEKIINDQLTYFVLVKKK